jgi:hypothetical protein
MMLRRLCIASIPAMATLQLVRPVPVRADTRTFASAPKNQNTETHLSNLKERYHVQNKIVREMTQADLTRWEPFQSSEYQTWILNASDQVLDDLDYIRVMYDRLPLSERRKANLMRSILNSTDKNITPEEKQLYEILIRYYNL